MSSEEPLAVFITAPNRDEARLVAETLVTNGIAACVQILPEIESVYRWQGAIERQPEVLLIAKTTRGKFTQLETEVRRIHTYETPEIVALRITEGSAPYLEWLMENVRKD
jgi:periplasmic divalent cation tolerance protein